MRVVSEFQPDYFNIVNYGIESLDIRNENSEFIVKNKFSNMSVQVNYPESAKSKYYNSLFGIILNLEIEERDPKISVKKVIN